MTDEDKPKIEEEIREINLDTTSINEYAYDNSVIKFVKSKFKRLPKLAAIELIKQILRNNVSA